MVLFAETYELRIVIDGQSAVFHANRIIDQDGGFDDELIHVNPRFHGPEIVDAVAETNVDRSGGPVGQ